MEDKEDSKIETSMKTSLELQLNRNCVCVYYPLQHNIRHVIHAFFNLEPILL